MGPNLRNCPQCGRVFAFQGRDICQKCLEKEDEDYGIVRKYVRDHPRASVVEVAEETGVDEDKILQFLRDGRLISGQVSEGSFCERCGRRIAQGRYCDGCLGVLDNQIKGVVPQPAVKPAAEHKTPNLGRQSNRMHIKGLKDS